MRRGQPCASCHKNGVYKGTPRDCVGCHLTDYQRTTNPNHAASGIATTCETCHRPTDTSWKGSGLSHASPFALVGLHATQACARPQERRLQGHAARLRRLPPDRLPAHDQPEPRRVGNRDDLRDVPHRLMWFASLKAVARNMSWSKYWPEVELKNHTLG